ncbi:MAG: TMEM43 family protein [Luteimonas sp.]
MRVAALLALIVAAGVVTASDPPAVPPGSEPQDTPVGEPIAEHGLRDTDFGVVTHRFGLERTVEMYQWNRAGQGYFAGWTLQPVDSTGFAPGHANPGKFPLESRQWGGQHVTLDGKPLSADAIAKLGEWKSFRPNFSALPGNLTATFQPEGDGLGSADNPLDPQVGDLRVTWREWVLPPMQGRVVLRGGEWVLPGVAPMIAPDVVQAVDDAPQKNNARWLWAAGLLALIAAAIALRWGLRHRRRASAGNRGL